MGATEDAMVRYVIREITADRPLADVLKDPYITNRASAVDARRLAEDLRGKLGSL
jgi:hypothetical protein